MEKSQDFKINVESIVDMDSMKAELIRACENSQLAGLPVELLLSMCTDNLKSAFAALYAGKIPSLSAHLNKLSDLALMADYLVGKITTDNIIQVEIEQGADLHYSAYATNVEGIYGAGATLDEAKASVNDAIFLIKEFNEPEQIPDILKGDFILLYKIISTCHAN